MTKRKQRNFRETVELQISLKDYDPLKDKRFAGSIVLPHVIKPNKKVCIIANAKHLEDAKTLDIDGVDIEYLKTFNKNKK